MIMVAEDDKFKTVTSGAGWYRDPMIHGQPAVVFHGVKCPKCKHEFMPKMADKTVCPACGFREAD